MVRYRSNSDSKKNIKSLVLKSIMHELYETMIYVILIKLYEL